MPVTGAYDGKAITSLDDMNAACGSAPRIPRRCSRSSRRGAVAVTLPPDEFALALRTHRIDGAESTLPTYVDSGYYLLAPYWTYDRHSYNADVLVASSGDMGGVLARGADHHCSDAPLRRPRGSALTGRVQRSAMLRASRSGCYMALLSEEQTELFRERRSRFTNTFPMRRRRSCAGCSALAEATEKNASLCPTSVR